MKDFFKNMKKKFMQPGDDAHMGDEGEEDYLELETDSDERKSKVIVRTFNLDSFDNIKSILDSLRVGHTIALVNIKPLKDKDLVELKRAISKLKKTCEAIDGDIAGFGEDYLVCTPAFAEVYRSKDLETSLEVDKELD